MANPNAGENGKKTRFRTGKEQAKTASKGGKASAKKRKEFASFQDCFKEQIDDDIRKELFNMLYGRAKRGNLKAFEILRDTMGEKPTERAEIDVYEDDGLMDILAQTANRIIDDTDMTGGGEDG